MQCTGAAKPGVFKWTITRRGPVIADVMSIGLNGIRKHKTKKMNQNQNTGKLSRTFWGRIWYPTEEDVIGFRVFQMISIPLIMVITVVINIFIRSATFTYLMMAWLILSVIMWVVASIRFKQLNTQNK